MKSGEYRALIKFSVKVGIKETNIHSRIVNVYPSIFTIKNLTTGFNRCCKIAQYDRREERLKSASSSEKGLDIILKDRRTKVREIAKLYGKQNNALGELNMKDLCAQWVPRLSTAGQKHIWTTLSQQ